MCSGIQTLLLVKKVAIPEISIPRKYLMNQNSAFEKLGASLYRNNNGLSKLFISKILIYILLIEVKSNFPGRIFEIIKSSSH